MDIDYDTIGKRIKDARLKAGHTQESLAEIIDISIPHLSKIENGSKGTTLTTIIKIANTLDISIDSLVHENINNKSNTFYAEADYIIAGCTDEEISKLLKLLQTGREIIRK